MSIENPWLGIVEQTKIHNFGDDTIEYIAIKQSTIFVPLEKQALGTSLVTINGQAVYHGLDYDLSPDGKTLCFNEAIEPYIPPLWKRFFLFRPIRSAIVRVATYRLKESK